MCIAKKSKWMCRWYCIQCTYCIYCFRKINHLVPVPFVFILWCKKPCREHSCLRLQPSSVLPASMSSGYRHPPDVLQILPTSSLPACCICSLQLPTCLSWPLFVTSDHLSCSHFSMLTIALPTSVSELDVSICMSSLTVVSWLPVFPDG
jgi:hypothetical protein